VVLATGLVLAACRFLSFSCIIVLLLANKSDDDDDDDDDDDNGDDTDRGVEYEFRLSARNGVDYGDVTTSTIRTPDGSESQSRDHQDGRQAPTGTTSGGRRARPKPNSLSSRFFHAFPTIFVCSLSGGSRGEEGRSSLNIVLEILDTSIILTFIHHVGRQTRYD